MATTTYRIQDLKQFTGSLSASDFLLAKIKKRTGMVGDEDMKISLGIFLEQVSQGFYPSTGGVLSGNMTIGQGFGIYLTDVDGTVLQLTGFTSDKRIQLGSSQRALTLLTDSNVTVKRGSNSYEVYHTGNLPQVTKLDTFKDAGLVGQTATVNMGEFTDYRMTLQNPETTIEFSSGLVQRSVEVITISLVQGTGSNKVKWPTNIQWANGFEPTLSYRIGYTDIISFISYDYGVNWVGLITAAGVK